MSSRKKGYCYISDIKYEDVSKTPIFACQRGEKGVRKKNQNLCDVIHKSFLACLLKLFVWSFCCFLCMGYIEHAPITRFC